MDALELSDRINTIFSKELRNMQVAFPQNKFLGSRKYLCSLQIAGSQGNITEVFCGSKLGPLNDYYDKTELCFENLQLLLRLYNLIKENGFLEREFTSILTARLNEGIPQIAYLSFETLIKMGKLDDALLLLTGLRDESAMHCCLLDLNALLRFETNQFLPTDLKKIENSLQNIKHLSGVCRIIISGIYEQINEIKHRALKKELSETNSFEIERNKEEVKQKLKEQKFDTQLIKAIDRAGQKYNTAKTEEEFCECLDITRKVLDNLTKEMAKRIIKTDKPIKGKLTNAADVRDYLRDQKLITEKQHGLVRGVYGFISDEGTHKLISTGDQARLGKNMLIEVSLLLLKNSEKYKL